LKLALLIGNRYNPWHFQVYGRLPGNPEVTVFRADSEIQRYFDARGGTAAQLPFGFETIRFDSQPSFLDRFRRGREPRIVPFHERLMGYDVVQSWELFTDWSNEAAIARSRGGPRLAVMAWDNIPFNMDGSAWRREVKARVREAADVVIVHTERSYAAMRLEGIGAERLVRVPPGVDADAFSPGAARAEGEGVRLLFVGWFLPRKGLAVLLYALRGLLDDPALRGRPVRLDIVGSGPGKEVVDGLIARLGLGDVCHFHGSVPYERMPDMYRNADVFVFPSIPVADWQEQFGMALLEAMACGVPCVTTYSGAIPEVAGDAAVLCAPADFVSLRDAIRGLIVEPERRAVLGAAGRARVLARYTLAHLANGLAGVYAGLLE